MTAKQLESSLAIERKKVRLLHDATIILRDCLLGYRTVAQDVAFKDARRLVEQVAELNRNSGDTQ